MILFADRPEDLELEARLEEEEEEEVCELRSKTVEKEKPTRNHRKARAA